MESQLTARITITAKILKFAEGQDPKFDQPIEEEDIEITDPQFLLNIGGTN